MNKKVGLILAVLCIIIILVTAIGYFVILNFLPQQTPPSNQPTVLAVPDYRDSGIVITVKMVDYNNQGIDINSDWTSLNSTYYLLAISFPFVEINNASVGGMVAIQEIYFHKSSPNNIASGPFNEIRNTTKNGIRFNDNDGNGKISANDEIFIDYNYTKNSIFHDQYALQFHFLYRGKHTSTSHLILEEAGNVEYTINVSSLGDTKLDLTPPEVNLTFIEKNHNNYSYSISTSRGRLTEEDANAWLEAKVPLNKSYYLMANASINSFTFVNDTTGRTIGFNDFSELPMSNNDNISSGVLSSILDDTENITYFDDDNDSRLSDGDVIIIREPLIKVAYNRSINHFVLDIFYRGPDTEGKYHYRCSVGSFVFQIEGA